MSTLSRRIALCPARGGAAVAVVLLSLASALGCRDSGSAGARGGVAASAITARVGCADGEREGFVEVGAYPRIAGCSGAWTIPGIFAFNPGEAPACPGVKTHDTTRPTCGGSGDDSPRSSGDGCTVADLCAAGWHVCSGAADVAASSGGGCKGVTTPGDPPLFFATRQSSTGCAYCATGEGLDARCGANACATGCRQTATTSNDVFGCGNLGMVVANSACGPLDRFSNDRCNALLGTPWSCDLPGPEDDKGLCEAYTVTKRATSHGGVLCCKDAGPGLDPGPAEAARPAFDCALARAVPARLSPPDGTMRRIAIEGIPASSPQGSVAIVVTSIRQDEPIEGEHHGGDAKGVGEASPSVRARSSGAAGAPGDGRVYHLTFNATDPSGASCAGEVKVCVPFGDGADCRDEGSRFDATEEK